MALPPAALELENRYVRQNGAPTLGLAYELLRDRWRSGDRDREVGLHLMFLAWFASVEPPFLTGLDARFDASERTSVFNEVHAVMLADGTNTTDAEALYVVGLMAYLAPWALGPEDEWTARGRAYRARCRQLSPDGIAPTQFAGRGAYGDYFSGQAAVKDES